MDLQIVVAIERGPLLDHGRGQVRLSAMKETIAALGKIGRGLTAMLKWLTVALVLVVSLVITANILLHYIPITPLHWSDEIVELCLAGFVFYGAAAVWMAKGHFSVGDWISMRIKGKRAQNANKLVVELSSVFQIPKSCVYSCMPISALTTIAYSLVYVVKAAIGTVSPEALARLEIDVEGQKPD
jgi:TRAP-type transport system small permease protein